ncbi:hypothetical protein LINPERHAP1_LOCUS19886 [Linum perenne]
MWGKPSELTWLLLMGNERSMLGFVWKSTWISYYSGGMTLMALSSRLFMKFSKPFVSHAAIWSKTS